MAFPSIQHQLKSDHSETPKARLALLKKALPYFLLPFLLVSLFISGFYAIAVQEERQRHESTQSHQLDLLAAELSHELRATASQLKVLASHHELASWLESGDDSHLISLTQEFTAFAEVMKDFAQVRLLDTSGMERIRVNSRKGIARVVPSKALQNKSGRYYFDQTMQLDKGEIYLSFLDLNMEQGKREQPLNPVIRFGIPLSDRSGKKRGALIINYKGVALIQHLNRHVLETSELSLSLVSKKLSIQYTPAKKGLTEWQFIYDSGKARKKRTALREQIGERLSGQFYAPAGLMTFKKFYPMRELAKDQTNLLGHDPSILGPSVQRPSVIVVEKGKRVPEGLNWQFVSVISKDLLYANSRRIRFRLLMAYAFSFLAIAAAALAIVRTQLRNAGLKETLVITETRHEAWIKSGPFLKKNKGVTKILVVEDEAITALDIAQTLRRLGYEVTGQVDTGEEAIAQAGIDLPDLVLMDLHLRGKIDGITAAEKISARFKIPIVFLSAHADQGTIARAKTTMASGFVVKPFREKELGITIEMALYKNEFLMNLSASEERFRAIFDQSTDPILLIEPQTRLIVTFNNKAHQNMAYAREDFARLKIEELEADQSKEAAKRRIERILSKGELSFQTKHRTKQGHIRDVRVTARKLLIKKKAFILFVINDFTERKRSAGRERLADSVFANVTEGMTITDADCTILSVNAAFTTITGYSSDEVIGKRPDILKSGRHNKAFFQAMWNEINSTGRWKGEIWNRRKNGEIYPEWLSITAVTDESGKIVQYAGLFSDITQRKVDEDKLLFQAHYDPLTELPNRILLRERLSQALKQIHRNHRKVALLFLDLDHFKQVNDTFGHLAGDAVLKQTAGRLLACVRETDTVARTGGDVFLILLPEIEKRQEAVVVAKKIIEKLSQAFQYEGQDAFLGGSIGITLAPDDGETEIDMIKSADMSLYKAKAEGRNTYRFFSKNMLKTAQARTLLEWNLKQALKNEELRVYYQPIIDLDSLKTVSLEALIRWEHPREGLLFPDSFIPIAEESDLIRQIGDWVLETACTQMKQWQEQYGLDIGISVNVSIRQIKQAEFWQSLTRTLDKSRLSAKSLTLEITESLMVAPVEEMIEKLKILKQVGVSLSIDDFGTGYSSLSYLARFPFDKLKIDKSFIQNLSNRPEQKPLVETIVHLGKSMKLKVIAEGIEQHEELSYLKWLNCDMGQGYYFSKAIPAEAYEKVLEKQKK